MNDTIVFLDSIRSAHNVGSVFRTCDGAGVGKVLLAGYTPTPIDRFGRVQPEIQKTSLGASGSVSWEKVEAGGEADRLITLKAAGYTIVAVEQAPESSSLYEFVTPQKTVYIFGNEVTGVAPALVALADTILEIPMHGSKESLNVSVTAGIVLFYQLR